MSCSIGCILGVSVEGHFGKKCLRQLNLIFFMIKLISLFNRFNSGRRPNMKWGIIMNLKILTAIAVLGVGLVEIYAHPSIAGISTFSITRDSPVRFDSNTSTYNVSMRGSLICSNDDTVSISLQITQYHGGEDFDTAAGFTPKPIACPSSNTLDWRLAARCTVTEGCITKGLTDGPALAVATAITLTGKIAQTTSEIMLQISK